MKYFLCMSLSKTCTGLKDKKVRLKGFSYPMTVCKMSRNEDGSKSCIYQTEKEYEKDECR